MYSEHQLQLQHVCMWSGHEWKRVTPKDFAMFHPGGAVHARGGLLRCELCGQYVGFPDCKVQAKHFRHSQSYKDKSCPERLHAYYEPKPYTAESRGLPLRIRFIPFGDFCFEIGFILPPSCISSSRAKDYRVKISPMGLEYSLSILQEGTITYLSAGTDPKPHYTISVDPTCKELLKLWPANVDGVSEAGTVFDGGTGEKLPHDSDVLIKRTYYIVAKRQPFWTGHVRVKACRQSASGWTVYEAEALDFSEEAARFFWDNYRCRLTGSTAAIIPLWPVHVESPYLVFCSSGTRKMSFFLRGNAELRVFPPVRPEHHGRVYSVAVSERQQLIAAGRLTILRYMYIWKDDSILAKQTPLPEVDVRDGAGSRIPPGEYSQLPQGKSLTFTPPFDGCVITLKDGGIIGRSPLNAGTATTIDAVAYGCTVEAFQGLDLVWRAEYKHRIKDDDYAEDSALLRKLEGCYGEIIPVPHSLGALAAKMQGCPLAKKWLAQRIREGRMSQRAYKILTNYFTRS